GVPEDRRTGRPPALSRRIRSDRSRSVRRTSRAAQAGVGPLRARRLTAISAMAEKFDAIIIGTGQGGKPLAGALAEAGWRTAIVERARVGGTCIIDGCTPTKTMIASARVAHLARRASDYGVRAGSVEVNLAVVRRRKREVVETFSAGSERGMRRHATLELILGEARFVGSHEVEVTLNE